MFFVPKQGGSGCWSPCVAWDFCGDKQDKLCLYSAPQGKGESSLEPGVWKCIAVLLQRVLELPLCGALTGGKGVPECTKRLNMGLCVYIYLFIFKLKT